ncbi:GPI-anchor transamidase component PIGU-like [Clavelina lepadiformis]|uniref:GPI-anchor transamidase component PIGU-like n=1 Tax=Clavelina lepadiformis TaxID=159417 RepID=UPI00404342A1
MLLYISLAVLLRAWLFAAPEFVSWLSSLPEVSTPLSSWHRVVEGISVLKQGGSIHEGDSYHGSTLLLIFMSRLQECSPLLLYLMFATCDIVTSLALLRFAEKFIRNELIDIYKPDNDISSQSKSIKLNESGMKDIPLLISLLYLFNPFTIATCVSKCTLIFSNMFLALFLNASLSGSVFSTTLFLALATYESLYPIVLLFAAALCYYKYQKTSWTIYTCMLLTTLCFLMWLSLLFVIAYLHDESLESIVSHYSFILRVPDQTPNVGVFWYFFTEVFDHFQSFFLCVFQLNVIVFSIPMSIKLRSHPVCLSFILIGIVAALKSYPSLGDAGLWLSILPLWSHTFKYLRMAIVTSIMLITTAIVCPVMWNLWIGARSANANFFFASSLAYTTAQVLILTDVLLAYLKWHYHLREGVCPKLETSNEKAMIRLLN